MPKRFSKFAQSFSSGRAKYEREGVRESQLVAIVTMSFSQTLLVGELPLSTYKLYFGICQCAGIYATFRCLASSRSFSHLLCECVYVGIINCDPLCGFRVGFDLIFACQFIYLAQVELVTAKLC